MFLPSLLALSATIAGVSAHALHIFPRGSYPPGYAKEPDTFAPLPGVAKGIDISKLGYAVQDFGGGAFMITEGSYSSMFLTYETGVIVVDAPPTIGHKLEYAIRNITSKPVTHVVYSHAHSDHIGGAFLFTGYGNSKNITIIAHSETHRIINRRQDPLRPSPTLVFDEDYILKVGNQTLELAYKGPNHEPGNIFIWAKQQKVLMIVDIIYPGFVPFSELALSGDVPGWIAAHDQILKYDFSHFVAGHLNRAASREDVETQREYVNDLFNNCKTVIEKGATDDPKLGANAMLGTVLSKYPGNMWAPFKVYLDTTASACANLTNEKWAGKLGGWDAFGVENAYKMITSLRVDWDILGPFGVSP